MQTHQILIALFASITMNHAHAGPTDVVDVKVKCSGDSCRFDVTLQHADTGWDHYANKWQVLTPDGDLLGERILYHPHVHEQPFTRSLSGVRIPRGLGSVRIRGFDSVHGDGGMEMTVAIPR